MTSPVGSSPESSGCSSITVSLYSYGRLSSAILQYSPSSNSVSAAKSTCHDNWPVTSTKEEFLKNEIVVSFLERTQNEIVNSLKTSSDALSQERGSSEEPKSYSSESKIITTSTHQKPNISPVVKVCSEESCHWSVAFVEELANSLSLLRYGADVSHSWKLSVTTFHRDLEALKPASNGSDLIKGHKKGNGYEDEMVQ
ncbi:hypothetical protein N7516_008871 [Penicillium verrucosum]|uniref:uncharacterized protein n=1 Tax=Penicillium verrucosum TaxID=60171 RepID=UPI0025451E44|nr:uncharacterized protein N7516_008871 [Penicillium verrucosum]KAJ5927098.1 hypothetical protein N7516_008871 [Penicillium verrucosum]